MPNLELLGISLTLKPKSKLWYCKRWNKNYWVNFAIMKILHHIFLVSIISLLLTFALLNDKSLAESSCSQDAQTMSKVELYFGLDIPGGETVRPQAWEQFVDEEVTPRFPDGLTIDEVSGQWQDAKTGETVQESSRVLMILYKPSEESEKAIEEIRTTYKSQFRQDSVMRLDETNCVSF